MRVKLIVAYDGTNYCGWQIQPNAVTVESVLNEALKGLLKENIRVIGASRTDSGVHALGNVAVFDTDTRIPAEKISYALNAVLPEDIRVQKSEQVEDDFHPRHCDTVKTYEYRILNREFALPTKRYDSIHCLSRISTHPISPAKYWFFLPDLMMKSIISHIRHAEPAPQRRKRDQRVVRVGFSDNGSHFSFDAALA